MVTCKPCSAPNRTRLDVPRARARRQMSAFLRGHGLVWSSSTARWRTPRRVDGSSLGGQLFAGLLLQLKPSAVDGVQLGLERERVNRRGEVGGRSQLVPPGPCFGEPGGAAGGRVGGDLQQRSRGLVAGPAAATDREFERGDQVG